jgi:cell division cycle protein 37
MPLNYSKWDHLELSDDEDNFHPNIDNNLMIRLQREKRQQREAEEEAKIKQLEQAGTEESKDEIEKIKRLQKLHVGNICHDKYSSKHVKGKASSSASPQAAVDTKLKIAASDETQFMDGYDDFLKSNLHILEEYAAIDEEDEKSEQYILSNTQLLSEHATGYYLLHCINLQAEGKTRTMRKTARQYLLLTYVVDLAKSMPGRDARDAIRPLFKKMASSAESREAFSEHLEKYIAHVKTRAEVKKEEQAKSLEADEETEYVSSRRESRSARAASTPQRCSRRCPPSCRRRLALATSVPSRPRCKPWPSTTRSIT